jgi:hypothetical protein
VHIDNENCGSIADVIDPTNLLHRLLPDESDPTFVHANAIDWYGNATFNYLQMPRFLEEWDRIANLAEDQPSRELIVAIRTLAERVRDDRHLYLVFRGD